MEFKRTLNSRAMLKKQKKYSFDFTEEDIAKGRGATFDKPYFCKREKNSVWFALYMWKGKLNAQMLHSYDKFEEVKPNDGDSSIPPSAKAEGILEAIM